MPESVRCSDTWGVRGTGWRADTEARWQWVGKNGRKRHVSEIIDYPFMDLDYKGERLDSSTNYKPNVKRKREWGNVSEWNGSCPLN